ncbi:MAG TPA: tRNA pseudouridine(13) synthase TruD [Steroidobacteraceae bacterium]|nr:tRNA pseudouridine(13) synthase TruD [Steroidobacteraceae bacterium]
MIPTVPGEWRSAALDAPRALGEPVAAGRLRTTPEDFEVDEELPFQPDGRGLHWLLHVSKRDANTEWVAGQLAQIAGVRASEVGFAGLKDRHALVRQWFSVPQSSLHAADWLAALHQDFQVLEAHPHGRKLRRGALAANRFRIRVQQLRADARAVEERITAISRRGVPNYFGVQRFGREAANLARVQEWAESGRLSSARSERSFTISAARSLVFNAVLAERVSNQTWDTLLPGDVANLDGSRSIFAVSAPTTELHERCAALDIHPTGPLWGAGEPQSAATVQELEQGVARRFEAVTRSLASVGLEQERRALRLRVDDLRVQCDAAALTIEFRLGPGAFATAVLRELLQEPEEV